MGSLSEIDLNGLIEAHDVRYLVEFGTGQGEDAAYAANFAFDHIYSLEGTHKLAIQAAFRHAANQKMTFIHGKGERGWRQVFPEIPAEMPVLFLLDGEQIEQDLAAIAKYRNVSRDLFLIESGDLSVLHALFGASHKLSMPAADLFCAAPAV
jgi:hypothetical protein